MLLISQSNGVIRKGTFQADIPSTIMKEKGNKKHRYIKAYYEKSYKENQQTSWQEDLFKKVVWEDLFEEVILERKSEEWEGMSYEKAGSKVRWFE